MIHLVHGRILPAALELLPPELTSREAHALVLAIGLQESGFLERRQLDGGPARGFWQFERGGGTVGVPWVAWAQYLKAWQPGKPRRATWSAYYTRAWELTDGTT